MNENRRPQRGDADRRRPGRGPQERVVEEVEGQLEGRNAVQEALKSGRTIDKVFVARGDADRRRPGRGPQERVVEEVEGQLEGRNAVQEALKSGRTIDKVFVASGDTDRGLQRLAAQAKEAGAVVVSVDRRKLDAMSFTRSHQGIIALAAAHDYCTIDDILAEAAARGEAPLVVICDELSDPHNLGAILRSAWRLPMITAPSTIFWQRLPPGGRLRWWSSATSFPIPTTWVPFCEAPSAPVPTA